MNINDAMRADMHVHTSASDGLFSPEEVVNFAGSIGLDALAVTDHDTTFNTEKVNTLCQNSGITGINGIEISAYDGAAKVHTLGYGFDLSDPQFNSFLDDLVQNSVKRTEDIIYKLNRNGVKLTFEAVAAARISDKTPIHVMHVALAAVNCGLCAHPFEFYDKYLMAGKIAFSNICRIPPEQAIEIINTAGGLAVLAHPGRIELEKSDLKKLILRLVAAGLGGIEAVYSSHTLKETAYFKEIAEDLGLIVTGGSDAHYSGGGKRIGEPVFHISGELRQRLKI